MSHICEQFRDKIKPFLNDWGSIDLRVIAKQFQEVLVFNAVFAVLDPNPPSQPTRKDLPSVDKLLVVHERWKIDRIDELLQSVSKGDLSVGGNIVQIKRFDGQSWHNISTSIRFYDRKRCNAEHGIDYASLVLEGWERSQLGVEEREIIDHKLRSAPRPWDGVADLRQHFIGFERHEASRRDSANLNIIAPLRVRLKEASLEEDKIGVVLDRSTKTNLEGISLAVFARHLDDSRERVSYPIKRDEAIIARARRLIQ